MGPAFNLKVMGPGSHIKGPRSQVKGPSWRVLGLGSHEKVPGPESRLWILCPGAQVKFPRWRVPGPGSHVWGPGRTFPVCLQGNMRESKKRNKILQ